jgi:hypothetical protein
MALRSDQDQLIAAWRGLAAAGAGDGWQTISLGTSGTVEIRAAKLFPDALEAFLVGFPNASVPADADLPQALGFRTSRVRLSREASTWMAVVRNGTGSLDLFAAMASDVLSLLQSKPGTAAALLLTLVLARITAWQRFMERGSSGLLAPKEELGLFGELLVLRDLLVEEPDATSVIETWSGPFGTLHDFPTSTGALEVKTTLAEAGFLARITSLDQLDTSVLEPLFIVAVRVGTDPAGSTLGDLASAILELISADGTAVSMMEGRLLAAGLPRKDFSGYTKRFVLVSTEVHRVTKNFPRLVRGNLPSQITDVRYTIDLDLVTPDNLSIRAARDILRNG